MMGLAQAMCDLAAGVLPRGSQARYVEEWRSDLAADPDHALSYAASVLANAPTLRLTLTGHLRPERPLLCRIGRHQYVTVHDNPENMRFTSHVCERCGYVKDDWRGGEQIMTESFAWGNAPGGLR